MPLFAPEVDEDDRSLPFLHFDFSHRPFTYLSFTGYYITAGGQFVLGQGSGADELAVDGHF